MKITALNIGSKTIKYLVVKDGSVIDSGSAPVPEGIVKNGFVLQPKVAGEQLKSLFSQSHLPAERVVCSLNGLPFSYRFFNLPRMETPSLHEAISRTAAREMPAPVEELYLSWQAYPAGKNDWHVLVSGVARRAVDALMQAFSLAGVRPYSLCLPITALPAMTCREDAIIVDFEPDYANIVLLVRGVPAGIQITQSLNSGASLPEQAGQLIREMTRMAGFYNDRNPVNPLPESLPVLLTGELSHDPSVAALIRSETGYPVELLEPPPDTFTLPAGLHLDDFAVNAGAALLERERSGKEMPPYQNINFGSIIKEREQDRKNTTIKRTLLSAALGVGVIALSAAYLLQSGIGTEIAQARNGLGEANARLALVQEAAGRAAQTEKSISDLLAGSQAIQAENRAVFSHDETVSDIDFVTKSLPPQVTFNVIDINKDQITIRGSGADKARIVEYVKALESSGKFAQADINWIEKPRSAGSSGDFTFLITIER
jgi:Tfp pilus assembly PilM family ATPase/Tfp pilus assembly protein PilN